MGDIGSGVPFSVEDPLVQIGIRHVLETVAKETQESVWGELVGIFQEAELAGEGIPAIQERINAFYGMVKEDWYTERIARTTMNGASNMADVEAWKQSGVVEKKVWISALQPNRSRQEHMDAHGQEQALDAFYIVGGERLMYPGDPNGSPGNIINCLCTQIAKVMEIE
jgi:hypothetical protein